MNIQAVNNDHGLKLIEAIFVKMATLILRGKNNEQTKIYINKIGFFLQVFIMPTKK